MVDAVPNRVKSRKTESLKEPDNERPPGRELAEFSGRSKSSFLEVEGRPSKGGGGSSAVDG